MELCSSNSLHLEKEEFKFELFCRVDVLETENDAGGWNAAIDAMLFT